MRRQRLEFSHPSHLRETDTASLGLRVGRLTVAFPTMLECGRWPHALPSVGVGLGRAGRRARARRAGGEPAGRGGGVQAMSSDCFASLAADLSVIAGLQRRVICAIAQFEGTDARETAGLEAVLVRQAVDFERRLARFRKEMMELRDKNRKLESELLELRGKMCSVMQTSSEVLEAVSGRLVLGSPVPAP